MLSDHTMPEYSLTIEQMKAIFDAGYDYRSSLLPEIIAEFGENSMPAFEEIIKPLT